MTKRNLLITLGLLLTLTAFFGIRSALAKPEPAPTKQTTPLHPTFTLLDEDSENVLTSGNAISTMKTCRQCHDTDFIQSHAFHSDLGLSAYKRSTPQSGSVDTQNSGLNSSNGLFGEWDPLTYRFLSQKGDERLDLSTAEWLQVNGRRVVGGGPATTSRDAGKSLVELAADPSNPETNILNSETGKMETWNWDKSGTIEMNCFLCHLENPNTLARAAFIQENSFASAGDLPA